MREEYTHDQPLAHQSHSSGLLQQSNDSEHASFGQASSHADTRNKVEEHSKLKMSIKAFQKLHPKEGVVQGEDANRVLTKLANIFKSTSNHVSSIQSGGEKARDGFENISPQGMKLLRNIVKSSHSIDINNRRELYCHSSNKRLALITSTATAFEAVRRGKLIQKRSKRVINVQGHEISIILVERSTSYAPHTQSRRTLQGRKIETIAKARIVQTSGGQPVIMAYIHYRQGPDGLQTLNPVISIGRSLPDDSLLFVVVKHGRVDLLRELLAIRRFTLRDRDTHGTPLLHVRDWSTSYNNIFLITSN